MAGALSHIRVLDLSRVLAGPWAGQTLADLGAEVIKVERPGRGDDTRGWGPPFLRDADGAETGESAYFLAANRGKKSVTIDFTRERGQDLVRALEELIEEGARSPEVRDAIAPVKGPARDCGADLGAEQNPRAPGVVGRRAGADAGARATG